MPLIDTKRITIEPPSDADVLTDAAAFESAFRFDADGVVTKVNGATFASKFRFIAIDRFEFAEFVGSFDFIANGFLNAEPNATDAATFAGKFRFLATDSVTSEALSIFNGKFVFEAAEHFVPAQEYKVSVNLTILPAAETNNNIRVWLPRLLVDNVEIPIISWSCPEGESNVGRKLSVVLQRWTDKDLFTNGAVVNFGIGKLVSGVWDTNSFITLIDNGTFQVSSHTISGQPYKAEDRVRIDLVGNLQTRLGTRPQEAIVVYDPTRITQRAEFYQTQYDQLGNAYATSLSPQATLSLRQLLQYVFIDKCGFTTVETNLPDYPILQSYFALGDRFYDGIKKFIGVFNPIIYQNGETIGIMDATLLQPSGFPDAEIVTIDRITNIEIDDDRTNKAVTAVRVQFIHNVEDYDTVTERVDPPFQILEGDNTITVNRTYRIYSKSSTPFVVSRQELISETRETRTPTNDLFSKSSEIYTYGADGKISKRKQEISAYYPDLDNWNKDPDTEPPYLFNIICRETETFEHKAYPIDSLDGSDQRTYISNRSVIRRGLIWLDPVSKHLGKPFKQKVQIGLRSGNINADTQIELNALLETIIETAEPVPGGLVNITTITTDYLPEKPQTTRNDTQQRPGDIASKQYVTSQRTLIIRPENTDPIEGIEDLNFGELPLDVALPLAKRMINAALTSPRKMTVQYIGYDDSLAPGQVRRFTLRDTGQIIGTFMIVGRTANGDANGTFMTLSCREV